jgi:hypothetical protein
VHPIAFLLSISNAFSFDTTSSAAAASTSTATSRHWIRLGMLAARPPFRKCRGPHQASGRRWPQSHTFPLPAALLRASPASCRMVLTVCQSVWECANQIVWCPRRRVVLVEHFMVRVMRSRLKSTLSQLNYELFKYLADSLSATKMPPSIIASTRSTACGLLKALERDSRIYWPSVVHLRQGVQTQPRWSLTSPSLSAASV